MFNGCGRALIGLVSNWTIIPVNEVRLNGREVSVQGMLAHLVEVDVAQEEQPGNTVSAREFHGRFLQLKA